MISSRWSRRKKGVFLNPLELRVNDQGTVEADRGSLHHASQDPGGDPGSRRWYITALVLGFASKSTLTNLISGLSLAIYRPFHIGDMVTIEIPFPYWTVVFKKDLPPARRDEIKPEDPV
jgi:hypothetical protein